MKISEGDLEYNSSTLEEFEKIKELNGLLLNNIEIICDSCCRHNESCDDDVQTRKSTPVPINKSLAIKYISESEPRIEKLIGELAPSNIQSNNDAIHGNIYIQLDSTIIYNCYHRVYGDTVIQHQLIYLFENKESLVQEVLEQKVLEPKWTYRIIKYYDTW